MIPTNTGTTSFVDDDHYVEFTVLHDEPKPAPVGAAPVADVRAVDDEGDTEPLPARHDHVLAPPAEIWHDEPVEQWHEPARR